MGNWNSGRRKAPTAVRVLRGTAKASALAYEAAPAAADDIDTPPEIEGDDVAVKEWKRLYPILRKCGLLSAADTALLIACCQQWAAYQKAQKALRADGGITIGSTGVPIRSPHFFIADKALSACLRMWGELGLTPG